MLRSLSGVVLFLAASTACTGPNTPVVDGASDECGFEMSFRPTPGRSLHETECLAADVRQATGNAGDGWRVIPVDVAVAVWPAVGCWPGGPVRSDSQVEADFVALNTAFAPSQIRFVPQGITHPDAAPLATTDAVLDQTDLFPTNGPNLVVLYVASLTNPDGGTLSGAARPDLGAVFGTSAMLQSTVMHEVGHALGLRHTHDCVVPEASLAGDATRTGDEIADTPVDPATRATECYAAPAPASDTQLTPGTCTLAGCTATCTDGAEPDETNLMSYYGRCRTTFSAGQDEATRCAVRRDFRARATCESGFTECEVTDTWGVVETCVNVAASEAHCGRCGHACAGRETCEDGTCKLVKGDCDPTSDAHLDCVRPCIEECMTLPHAVNLQCLRECTAQCCAEDHP